MDIKKIDYSSSNRVTSSAMKQLEESDSQTGQNHNHLAKNGKFLNSIKIGQQIELIVLKMTEGNAILQLSNSKTLLQTSDNELLQLGQRIKAEITATDPIIQLKILKPENSLDIKIQSLIKTHLRQTLPNQQPIRDLITNLQLHALLTLSKNSPLHSIKDRFIQSIPPLQAFESADILPQILKRSGLFTENNLKNLLMNTVTSFPKNDLKLSLLRLASQLENLNAKAHTISSSYKTNTATGTYSLASLKKDLLDHTELFKQKELSPKANIALTTKSKAISEPAGLSQEQLIDKLLSSTKGAIDKLQTSQLQHTQASDPQKTAWSFELPIRSGSSVDILDIDVEQEAQENPDSEYTKPTKIVLKFNLNDLGLIQAHILMQGTHVSVNFWIENKATSLLFSEHLSLLDTQLKKVGLDTQKLECHCNLPPEQLNKKTHSIINETL